MLVKFNRPSVLGFHGHLIKAGMNDLPAEIVALMYDDDIVAGKLDSGELEIMEVEAELKPGKRVKGTAALPHLGEGEGKKLVSEMTDVPMLESWLAKEKKVAVRKQIKAQIAKIKNVKFRSDEEKSAKYPKSEE